jgi:hypothetical protein
MKIRIEILFLVVCSILSLFFPPVFSLTGGWVFMSLLSFDNKQNPIPLIIAVSLVSSLLFTPLAIFPISYAFALLISYIANTMLAKQSFGIYLASIIGLICFFISSSFFSAMSVSIDNISLQIPLIAAQTFIAGCLGIIFHVIMKYYERKKTGPLPKAT